MESDQGMRCDTGDRLALLQRPLQAVTSGVHDGLDSLGGVIKRHPALCLLAAFAVGVGVARIFQKID